MAITPNFSESTIRSRLDKFLSVIDRRVVERLKYLGEMCVKHAKEIPPEAGFNDITGNLRSSIGYIVFKDGVAIHSFYEAVKDGADGVRAGKSLAERVGSRFNQGYLLVVTAGMSYAIHVESRGKDVLTSAEILAEQELPRMIKELNDNINKAING